MQMQTKNFDDKITDLGTSISNSYM